MSSKRPVIFSIDSRTGGLDNRYEGSRAGGRLCALPFHETTSDCDFMTYSTPPHEHQIHNTGLTFMENIAAS